MQSKLDPILMGEVPALTMEQYWRDFEERKDVEHHVHHIPVLIDTGEVRVSARSLANFN